MNVTVTFRHVDPTPALRQHAEEKLQRLKKYLHRPVDAHVILSVSKERHTAEVTLNADHESMFAKEVTHDLYSAIDLAVSKLEHQAQRVKEKREDHKGHGRGVGLDPGGPAADADAGTGRRIVVSQRLTGKPIPVDEARSQLERSGDEFLAFINSATHSMAVLYRRKDGSYGLIES
jgi:putative sigma-54 modulation protein